MNKLAHSHQPTMDLIDCRSVIENGDEDKLDDILTEEIRRALVKELIAKGQTSAAMLIGLGKADT